MPLRLHFPLVVIVSGMFAMPAPASAQDLAARFEPKTYRTSDDESLPYRFLRPDPAVLKARPDGKFPIVLFLHGAGERGTDNRNQLKYFGDAITKPENRQKFPCFVIAPQCRNNKKWADVDWSKKVTEDLPKEASEQAKVALAILDEVVKKYPVDEKRIYLTGLSMGGYGSWDIACRYPDKFAAVVPICGGGDNAQAAKLVKLPIFCFHGGADNVVPVGRSRSMIEAIKKAGGNPIYAEYPAVGHNSWDRAYNDADGAIPWMFKQAKP